MSWFIYNGVRSAPPVSCSDQSLPLLLSRVFRLGDKCRGLPGNTLPIRDLLAVLMVFLSDLSHG